MNTKEKILLAARAMFNAHGYWNVTIRMIAQELGISPGNLNYHFQKKEDLLEALYFRMAGEFDERVERLPEEEISFELIRRDMLSSMEQMMDYQFIWTDLYRLMDSFDKLYDHFMQAYQRRLGGYLYLFQHLRDTGLMRPEGMKGEYQSLAGRMIHYGDTWIYISGVYRKQDGLNSAREHCNQLLMQLHPYLTPEGQDWLLAAMKKPSEK